MNNRTAKILALTGVKVSNINKIEQQERESTVSNYVSFESKSQTHNRDLVFLHTNNESKLTTSSTASDKKNLEHELNNSLMEYPNYLSEVNNLTTNSLGYELNNKSELTSMTDLDVPSKCVDSVSKKDKDKRIKSDDYCVFCKTHVQSFSSHYQQFHATKTNAQQCESPVSNKSDVSSIIFSTDSEFFDSDADPEYMPSSSSNDEVNSEYKLYNKLDENSSITDNNSLPKHQNTLSEINIVTNQQKQYEFDADENQSNVINNNITLSKNTKKCKQIRQRDFCFYCESLVLNFARHLQRHHINETEVEKCFSYPLGSKERKNLFSLIRKKGNYIHNQEVIKPVRKPDLPNSELLPCVYCLGFYSKNQIRKHKKKCVGNPNNGEVKHLSDCQNVLIQHLKIDKHLATTVFPRMRADNISLVAKRDTLICAYGARYIKIHRESHAINVASRKMRDLARLLIEVQKIEPKIKTLFQCLNPVYFDILVSATKLVSNYDSERDFYNSPTYAINISTELKECCNIANTFALKRKEVFGMVAAAEAETNLKSMIELLKNNWKYEISSQAGNDLNSKKWNKITMVPLATDLKIFHEYLIHTASSCVNNLQENNNNKFAYVKLLETVYCRTILLNRKRSGELERMPLVIYEISDQSKDKYEEFRNIVSPTEQILLKRFKRIVIRGKRGRGVAVLFSLDVQNHIELLLKYRDNFVPKTNTYFFARAGHDTPISGYKTLQKHVKASGVKNGRAITATKLRKHLATITQIFNLNSNELEQLATFMGHTEGVHNKSYRLPDDVFQTAKVSKLLLLMEKGQASNYKGKSLDEINIDEELEEEPDSDIEDIYEDQNLDPEENIILECEPSTSKDVSNKSNKKTKRNIVAWTTDQKKIAKEYFKQHILTNKAPKKSECLDLMKKYSKVFEDKTWLKIKVYIQNIYTNKTK